ncbi:MAG: sel1 repeat family protein [Bacteroidales bacterium]|jgi:TPR repeat protein|nr:sel1 repeat family protein [Bacteroidales bacterium]
MSKGDRLYNKATKLALQDEYNSKEVIELLVTAIEKYRNGKAAYALATWYFFGKHMRKNYKKAFDLIQIAVEQEPSQLSCYNIAVSYESGKGTVKNLEKAFHYYLLSALYGYKPAVLEVGRCFYYGIGIAKNKELGLKITNLFDTE